MKTPEKEDEQQARALRELEGKNIAHYSVLLQTVIESELEERQSSFRSRVFSVSPRPFSVEFVFF
jgi:hypothetical protein